MNSKKNLPKYMYMYVHAYRISATETWENNG